MGLRDDAFRPGNDPLWYKDAIIYELHVRAFYDSNGDGIGDFQGLTERLDYLQELGITALWLLPFYPSPLRDDGYDIADYGDVHPTYGSLRDVRLLVREAHRRGLRVITELVCNHTSDQHPWFQRARRAKAGSSWRDFYVWSDSPERYREARIIFKDFENSNWSWDPEAKAYYWHRFYSHQPDLNYDNPQVRRAISKAMDFWLQMGIDGLRLDAVPYLYEREGTNGENLPETHSFLKQLRSHVDGRFQDRMLLAEANQWPEDAVAYFGQGDECNMAFHFPLMPRMFMSIRMEDRFPVIDILSQTPPLPESAQWALFLRNHDELTLEMVTDEERDYMYRVYATDPDARINLGIRRRLGPLLGNHRRRIELMNGLLFSLPGSPVIYYGDEIGMGDNIYLGDRNGVRTPMQWTADRNAGFSQANPQKLYLPVIVDPEYHYATVNVQAHRGNPHSLLSWMKRLIALRKQYRAFGRGSLEFLYPENRKVLAFVRRYQDETILVVANLSRFVQYAELSLSEFKGRVPVELWGQVGFPTVGEDPYFLTLGPHAFYWFSLETQRVPEVQPRTVQKQVEIPVLVAPKGWVGEAGVGGMIRGDGWKGLRETLPSYLQSRRWFRGKSRRIKGMDVLDAVAIPHNGSNAHLALINVEYTEGDGEVYLLPLSLASGEEADRLLQESPEAVIARIVVEKPSQDAEAGRRARRGPDSVAPRPAAAGTGGGEWVLFDALVDPVFDSSLLNTLSGRRRLRGLKGELQGSLTAAFRHTPKTGWEALVPSSVSVEQSNSSVAYGGQLMLKLFRRLEGGTNPDQEIGRFLTDKGFPNVPALVGSLEYQRRPNPPMTMAVLQRFVQNQGNAWEYTLDSLNSYFPQALAPHGEPQETSLSPAGLLDLGQQDPPPQAMDLMGSYLETAALIGKRTAEMHLALSEASGIPSFVPEPFSTLYQRSLYQSMRSLLGQVLHSLRSCLKGLPPAIQEDARVVLDLENGIQERFRALVGQRIDAMRIRCHGDYHLGQLLRTANDFMIIDFEGEPGRPLGERRIKRSALKDVAGMLRSFHYASQVASLGQVTSGAIDRCDYPALRRWAGFWNGWVSAVFLNCYLTTASSALFVPRARGELQTLLDAFVLEKAIYELGYELNNRPDWITIPLQAIPELVG